MKLVERAADPGYVDMTRAFEQPAESGEYADVTRPFEQPAESGEYVDVTRAFGQYRGYVATIGRRLLGEGHDLDDLIQDVFLTLHQNMANLRDPKCLKAWLATITTRSARRNLIRRATEYKNHDNDPEAIYKVPGNEISAELRFECAGSLERMRLLPPQLSRPWMLKYLDGMSLPLIAALCHCSPSTVQRRIRNAERQISGSTRELT